MSFSNDLDNDLIRTLTEDEIAQIGGGAWYDGGWAGMYDKYSVWINKVVWG